MKMPVLIGDSGNTFPYTCCKTYSGWNKLIGFAWGIMQLNSRVRKKVCYFAFFEKRNFEN